MHAHAPKFLRWQHDGVEQHVAEDAAVEHEPDAIPTRHVGRPVDHQQPPRPHLQPELLTQLARTRLAGALALLDRAAGNLPHGLVRRLDDQDVAAFIEKQGARCRERPWPEIGSHAQQYAVRS